MLYYIDRIKFLLSYMNRKYMQVEELLLFPCETIVFLSFSSFGYTYMMINWSNYIYYGRGIIIITIIILIILVFSLIALLNQNKVDPTSATKAGSIQYTPTEKVELVHE